MLQKIVVFSILGYVGKLSTVFFPSYLKQTPGIKKLKLLVYFNFAKILLNNYTDRNTLVDLQNQVTHLLDLLFESTPLLPVSKTLHFMTHNSCH